MSYTGIATPAYATAPAYPVGSAHRLYLGSGLATAKPTAAASGPGVAIFAKLYDVDPAGNITLVNKLISPARIAPASLGKPISIELPGIVHRFAKGHTLRPVIAGSHAAYGTNLTPQDVTVTSSPATPGTLDLPVVAGKL